MKKGMRVWMGRVVFCLAGLMVSVNGATAAEERSRELLKEATPIQVLFGGLELTIEGLIEVEAGYEKNNYDDAEDEDESSSDFSLATIELGLDVRANDYVSGRILFLYEEEPDAEIEVDEGYIGIGKDGFPLYLTFGRQYIPFGYFESHFISDPLTLELGETRETSLVAGYENDMINLFIGFFNGDVDEAGEDDNHIDNYLAGVVVTVPEMPFGHLVFGGTYLSNLAESDSLSEEIATEDGAIIEKVPGYSVFASLAVNEKILVEGEILGAVDEFVVGELSFDGGESCKPEAWNVELAYLLTDSLQFALRYGGSSDGGDFLPETLYGGCLSYKVLKNTFLALEFLAGEFENQDEITIATAQLAVTF